MSDIFSKEKRSEIMRKVRNRNTNIEILLRKALFAKGYRYKLNYKIIGSPDIVFPKQKIAIFCDGDFWHGKSYKKESLGYSQFWKEKIKTNMKRDKKVNKALAQNDWRVLRFWKSEILKNLDSCVERVTNEIRTSLGKSKLR